MPQAKQTIAEKMAELAHYKKYRYSINQIKKAALNGEKHTNVILSNCDAQAVQRLEREGFGVTEINNGNYRAYKINW